MRKISYNQSIENHATKIGGNLIDKTHTDYINTAVIPDWVDAIAVEHKKTSVQVIKDLYHYRNSWKYTKTIHPERTKVI